MKEMKQGWQDNKVKLEYRPPIEEGLMVVLIVGVILGIAIGYFASQNTVPVTLRVGEYVFADMPLYLIIVGSLVIGVFLSWILYLAKIVSSGATSSGKDYVAMRQARRMAADLEQRLQKLEAENVRLRTNQHSSALESPHHTLSQKLQG
jgi:uncharacterized integral membrane protein